MKTKRMLSFVLALLASFALAFTGCQQGPAEDAGETIDDTFDTN